MLEFKRFKDNNVQISMTGKGRCNDNANIERLWRLMRSNVTRNRFYESLNAVAEAAVDWLDTLPFAQFCSLMGIDERQLAFVNKPFS